MPITSTKCPECGDEMVRRKNRETGQPFWGCSNFPTCRGTRDVNGESKYDRAARYEDPDEEDDDWHPGHPSNYGDD